MMISAEKAVYFASVPVSTVVTALTIPADITPVRAIVQATSGNLRYKYDGGTPGTADGHIIVIYVEKTIEGTDNILNFRAVRDGSTDAVMAYTIEGI